MKEEKIVLHRYRVEGALCSGPLRYANCYLVVQANTPNQASDVALDVFERRHELGLAWCEEPKVTDLGPVETLGQVLEVVDDHGN